MLSGSGAGSRAIGGGPIEDSYGNFQPAAIGILYRWARSIERASAPRPAPPTLLVLGERLAQTDGSVSTHRRRGPVDGRNRFVRCTSLTPVLATISRTLFSRIPPPAMTIIRRGPDLPDARSNRHPRTPSERLRTSALLHAGVDQLLESFGKLAAKSNARGRSRVRHFAARTKRWYAQRRFRRRWSALRPQSRGLQRKPRLDIVLHHGELVVVVNESAATWPNQRTTWMRVPLVAIAMSRRWASFHRR